MTTKISVDFDGFLLLGIKSKMSSSDTNLKKRLRKNSLLKLIYRSRDPATNSETTNPKFF